jgi:hypothetical protein
MLRLQRSPSDWACLPTSFAMVLDMPVLSLLEKLGHDGSEIIWPMLSNPHNRRSFHIQEMIDLCWDLGKLVVMFQTKPCNSPYPHIEPVDVPMRSNTQERFKNLIQHPGVFTGSTIGGTGHAVAWDGDKIYDPKGKIYSNFKDAKFLIETFWAVIDSPVKR